MGEVYHAIDDRLERSVALKILSDQLTRSEIAVQRFVQEAHAASGLNHPNIVTVFDIGRAEAMVDEKPRVIHYIAMELIDGETLRSLVARNALSLRQRVDILSQMAAGLAKAHAGDGGTLLTCRIHYRSFPRPHPVRGRRQRRPASRSR